MKHGRGQSLHNQTIRPSSFIPPKKHLGQVFLTDQNIIDKIIASSDLKNTDTILEIGPGRGTLTRAIAKHAKEVIAVETDKRFCEQLNQELKENNVRIIHADFLKFDIAKLPHNLIIIGNLPYYITSPIMTRLLKYRDHFTSLFLTVQLEFGRRMIAKMNTKEYSALTCFIQYYTDTTMLFKIKNTSFKPRPKVDSCFMHLKILEKPSYPVTNESLLFKIIHSAFQQRRKTLANALRKMIEKEKLLAILHSLHINPQARAENISLGDFVKITNAVDFRK